MTDDLDSADHSAENDDSKTHEKTKRGRLKDAINRTRFMIAEARKHAAHSDKQNPEVPPNSDLDDFLAAGRVSNASSSHLSAFSETPSAEDQNPSSRNDRSTPPRPSTSDSKSQPSPKRIQFPRIDVSTSQRFPNAKEIRNNGPVELPASSAPTSSGTRPGSSLLLKPEYKSRSQSTSSLATPGRKARIRNLSVGFADTPPIIIGEGGDEAEAPTVEISRAKMHRARSASPQARNIRSGPGMPAEAMRRAPGREENDTSVDVFNPKPVSRVQTGALTMTPKSSTGYDAFVPKPFVRHQTGLSDGSNPTAAHKVPPLPARNKPFLPPDLGKSRKATLDLTTELEISLGFNPSSPATGKFPDGQEPRIYAPKPQRAPPSYDLIEGGGRDHGLDRKIESPARQSPTQNPQPQTPKDRPRQQNPQLPQQMPRKKSQQDSRKRISIIHELPSPQENPNSPTVLQSAGQPRIRQVIPSPQMQSPVALQQNQQHQMPQPMEQRVLPHTEQQFRQPVHQQEQDQPNLQSSQMQSSQQSQQHQVPRGVAEQLPQPAVERQQGRSSSQSSQMQSGRSASGSQRSPMPQSVEQRRPQRTEVQTPQNVSAPRQHQLAQIPPKVEQGIPQRMETQIPQQQQQIWPGPQSPQMPPLQHNPAPQQNQQYQVRQSMEQRIPQHAEGQIFQQNFQEQQAWSNLQSPQVALASQQPQIPQRIEQPILRQAEQQIPQPIDQQQQAPGSTYSQRLELPAEPVQQIGTHEQSQQNYPEFENFLRSSLLHDEVPAPNPKISRFASLHTTTRRAQNTSRERPNTYDQPPPSDLRTLPPLDTSSEDAFRSFAHRSKPNSRPTSLYGTPVTGTPHSSTIRRVTPPGHFDHSPSNLSSAVQSPHDAVDPVPNKMRFYESINKGNPPAGYI